MSKEQIPKDLQIVGLVFAVLLTAVFVDSGHGIEGGLTLFVESLPACAVGLVIYKAISKHEFKTPSSWPEYKAISKHEFKTPSSWPEWIAFYMIGMLIGGPLVALAIALYKLAFR